MNERLKEWKDPAVLLTSLGIAGIGDFIYLVAINIIVYQMTGSAAAVAGLWIIGPIVNILTKFWTGSFIDYRSKKGVIIATYLLRAGFIALLPFAPNIVGIYTILLCLSVAKSFFGPSSVTYTTMLVPKMKRKRFNSIRSVTSSGAFIIGPAIGGTLILLSSIHMTLWINAVFFVIAATLLMRLPEKEEIDREKIPSLTFSQVKSDFTAVNQFISKNKYIAFIYLGFILVMVFSFAMDAQEVVFTQRVIGLSEVDYSLLISITGIGSVSGGILLSVFSSKFSLRMMIVLGVLMTAVGYVIYAFSWSFLSITIGFLILGFFNVFMNAGISTFYQNNIPIALMGRVTSIFQLLQSGLQVIFILGIGILADVISLRITIIALAVIMLLSAFVFSYFVFKPQRAEFYQEEEADNEVLV
ncbi:MFS transporter [Planococcus halotolerans]|uniref:MFS transporter n=1 Tax=Planococcus halotolerans TaxID=2233542 RepID=A0A365L7K6_9BACL|nr:MFS transporter [Planococcus halotolerans]RAZ81416.1 MFS transporter [Planococcus halotolerans]